MSEKNIVRCHKEKSYPCPFCKKKNKTLVPNKSDVEPSKPYWDSVVTCQHCKALFFKKVRPSGMVTTVIMSISGIND